MVELTAQSFVDALHRHQSAEEKQKIARFFKGTGSDNQVIGVRMKTLSIWRKNTAKMPLDEVNKYYSRRA